MDEAITAIGWALGWTIGGAIAVAGMVATVRWAKRAGRNASVVGGALLLLMSMGVVPPQELQRIEEAKEPKGKEGPRKSGDSPGPRRPESGLPKSPEP